MSKLGGLKLKMTDDLMMWSKYLAAESSFFFIHFSSGQTRGSDVDRGLGGDGFVAFRAVGRDSAVQVSAQTEAAARNGDGADGPGVTN